MNDQLETVPLSEHLSLQTQGSFQPNLHENKACT